MSLQKKRIRFLITIALIVAVFIALHKIAKDAQQETPAQIKAHFNSVGY